MDTPTEISVPEKVKKIVFDLLQRRHTVEELEWQVPEVLAGDPVIQSLEVLEPITEAPLDLAELIAKAVEEFKKKGGRLRTWESEGILFS
jgi:hypothetical protein